MFTVRGRWTELIAASSFEYLCFDNLCNLYKVYPELFSAGRVEIRASKVLLSLCQSG